MAHIENIKDWCFKQPVLPSNKSQLNLKLKFVQNAIRSWNDKKKGVYRWYEQDTYSEDIIDKNIEFFKEQKRNINFKLK